MVGIPYVGRTPDSDGVVVPKTFADTTQAAAAVTTGAVSTLITSTQALLTTRTYADAQDLLVAHKTDVTTADLAYLDATRLNAASGIAGLDSSGNLLSAQVPSGVLTDRVAQCFSLSQGTVSRPAFDAIAGTGNSTSGPASWSHTGVAGATVLVGLAMRDGPASGAVTYGGSAMTLLTTISQTTTSGTAYTHWWYLQNIPGGAQTVSIATFSSTWWTGISATYTNVTSVGTASTAFVNATSGSVVSGTVAANQVVVQGFSGVVMSGNVGTMSFSGGNARGAVGASAGSNQSQIGLNDSTTSVTFGLSNTIAEYLTGMTVLLNGPTLPSGVGSLSISAKTTVTSVSTPGTLLATIPIPDLGFPYRALPFAYVLGDSSGATKPAQSNVGTGNYGMLMAAAVSNTSQPLGLGVCTGSFNTDMYPLVPMALTNQTPTSVPALTGAQTINLYGALWSGTTFSYYPNEMVFFVLCLPSL